jgi:hypothetical protein
MAGCVLCCVLTLSSNIIHFHVYVHRYCVLSIIISSSLLCCRNYILIIVIVLFSLLLVIDIV